MVSRRTVPPFPVPFILSVLKLSSKWDMVDGRSWAIRQLKAGAPSAQEFTSIMKLHVALKYQIPQWISPSFTALVTSDWTMDQLSCIPANEIMVEMFDIILRTRDIIEIEWKRLATIPPVCVRSSSCSDHDGCTSAWGVRWIIKIGTKLLDPDTLHRLEYYEAPGKVAQLRVPGMHPECLKLTVEEVQDGDGFNFESLIIAEAVSKLSSAFNSYW